MGVTEARTQVPGKHSVSVLHIIFHVMLAMAWPIPLQIQSGVGERSRSGSSTETFVIVDWHSSGGIMLSISGHVRLCTAAGAVVRLQLSRLLETRQFPLPIRRTESLNKKPCPTISNHVQPYQIPWICPSHQPVGSNSSKPPARI